jgi:hypothetical protein
MKRLLLLLVSLVLLAGCGSPELPAIPGLPQEMADLPLPSLEDLGLPDLSSIPGLPQLSDLPGMNVGPNAVAFAGPTERRLAVGEGIPGTDIRLVGFGDEGAEFQIGEFRSVRRAGDSLDYDGGFVGVNGVNYTARLRIYRVSGDSVRVAGVHRLVIDNIQPTPGDVSLRDNVLRIPYTASANVGEQFKGTTYGYVGLAERGGEISGLPGNRFPFHKVGDSVRWEGTLRPDIPIRYDLRVLFYSDGSMQIGGVVTLRLPE